MSQEMLTLAWDESEWRVRLPGWVVWMGDSRKKGEQGF